MDKPLSLKIGVVGRTMDLEIPISLDEGLCPGKRPVCLQQETSIFGEKS